MPRRRGSHDDVVYDVYRGRERLAWGLKSRASAERWIARLGGAAPRDERASETAPPRRPWWSEHD